VAGANSATLKRAGLQGPIDVLDSGIADVLVIAKLDRLSRSVAQDAQVVDRAKRKGWSLVALDFGLDTTTPAGEMVANVILSTAQYERRLIGQRTRDALAAKREQGVRLGRPQALPDNVVQRIVAARYAGSSFRAIAAQLEMEGMPTAEVEEVLGGLLWLLYGPRWTALGIDASKVPEVEVLSLPTGSLAISSIVPGAPAVAPCGPASSCESA
jgi:DNA invertase Pin-like site-specific DNA recombinase